MSLQYVRHLISSERQWLIRIAKGRCGCRRPARWKMERIRALLKCDAGSEGEGWTDEAIAAALDVSARRVGRWCRQDADEGPEAVLEPPRPRAAALPTGRRGRSAAPAVGPVRTARRPCARDLAPVGLGAGSPCGRVRDQLRNRAPYAEKRTNDLAPGATWLSAGAQGSLRGPDGRGAGSLRPAVRCALSRDLQGRTAQTAAGRNADAAPGAAKTARHPATMNKYVRHGAGTIWLFVEPLGPWRTAVNWARQVQAVVDHPRYRQAECLTLVCDNWNTHTAVSFYQAFPPAEARRLAQRVRLVFTPRHGSWLNIAEPELNVLTRQALAPRRPRSTRRSPRRGPQRRPDRH